MNDVFISYKREDEARVARLVKALEHHGLSIWWDRGLAAGEDWRAGITLALEQAKCVIVAWTTASTGPEGGFVRDEAAQAARRKILVPILLDRVAPPLGFGEIQAIELSHWRGSPTDVFLLDLVEAIRAKIESRPAAAAVGPVRRLRRRIAAGGLGTVAFAMLAAFAINALNVQQGFCRFALAQPTLSDACGSLGLGGAPSRDEREAWSQRREGDCQALREHLLRFPQGAFREQAAAMLGARVSTVDVQWAPVRPQPLNMYVDRDGPLRATEAQAKAAAIERGHIKAERLCRDFDASGVTRYKSFEIDVQRWVCDAHSGGKVCGFEGRALCIHDAQQHKEQETCVGAAGR